jgi:hypothetical protein
MLVTFFIFLLFSKTKGELLSVGDIYNISWENDNLNELSIVLESKINNNWRITNENNLNFLSLILDGNLNYYLWQIPIGLEKYNEYQHRLLVKNLEKKSIIKEIFFYINKITTKTPQITFDIKDNTDQNKDEMCIYKLCIPNYAFICIIIGLIILLCICIKCCCC